MSISELQKEILTCFANEQCWAREYEKTLYLNDESCVMRYSQLIEETKRTREELKPAVIALRNEQLIELVTAFDRDGEFRRGSGYILTDKGVQLCQQEKLSDELNTQS